MGGPAYWRHLAEEHGACLRDFMAAGVQPALCYEQAVIAGHFAHLYLEATSLPDIEPYPGGTCEHCGAALTFDNPPFCGACEERKATPMTLAEFLRYAADSTVNSR